MSDLHTTANAVRAAERALPPPSDHQLYVLRCIAEKCAALNVARVTSQHLATARSLQRRGLVIVTGHIVHITPSGLAEAVASVSSLSDEEVVRLAGDMGSCFRDAANEELDARESDYWSRRTPAGGEA